MNDFVRFGSPDHFEIAARWVTDPEPRAQRPLREGWSTGQLQITVGRQVLTEHEFRGERCAHYSWYLLPLMDWFINQWTWLFHEEQYAWADRYGQPAAVATLAALDKTLGSPDPLVRQTYRDVHAWWCRHALRAADASAIYPDIYIRRVADDVELSWLARQPEHAPGDFLLTLTPGSARLPVQAVAGPIWQFLNWAAQTARPEMASDQTVIADLQQRLIQLAHIPLAQLELGYINTQLQTLIDTARRAAGLAPDTQRATSAPVIEALDSAVLMFGGLNVDIEQSDVHRLVQFLAQQKGRGESSQLAELVSHPDTETWSLPYEEGYRLAEDLREALEIDPGELYIDIEAILSKLGITITEAPLTTSAIRGVAVAGQGFAPAILLNTSSFYNPNKAGQRFTLAHELCHILYDRTRAKRLSHLSGSWASARTEKRANAFAVMFLASATALRQHLTDTTPAALQSLAQSLGVGLSALVEHLCNLGLMGEMERDGLRVG